MASLKSRLQSRWSPSRVQKANVGRMCGTRGTWIEVQPGGSVQHSPMNGMSGEEEEGVGCLKHDTKEASVPCPRLRLKNGLLDPIIAVP